MNFKYTFVPALIGSEGIISIFTGHQKIVGQIMRWATHKVKVFMRQVGSN